MRDVLRLGPVTGSGRTAPEGLRPLSEAGLDDEVAWALVDGAPDGIVVADESGRILVVNRQIELMFEYDRGELFGRSVDDLLPERFRQIHRAHRTRYRAEPRTRPMGAGVALFGCRRDGTEFPLEISLSPLITDRGLMVVAMVRDISERLETEDRLREAERELHTLEDHKRIARDLHDIVIQQLFASGMTLQGVWSRIKEPEVAQRVANVVDDLDRTIREIRSVIFGLQAHEVHDDHRRSEVLRVVSDERAALGFEPRVHFEGVIESIPDEVAEQLLPTLRESLSNVARHANASGVNISVEVGDDVVLRVADDGEGLAEVDPRAGNGIRNMRERAEHCGGRFELTNNPEGGAVVVWRVPCTPCDPR